MDRNNRIFERVNHRLMSEGRQMKTELEERNAQ